VELAPAVVGCGNVSGRRVDKLARSASRRCPPPGSRRRWWPSATRTSSAR
jgi:hypothetical protein